MGLMEHGCVLRNLSISLRQEPEMIAHCVPAPGNVLTNCIRSISLVVEQQSATACQRHHHYCSTDSVYTNLLNGLLDSGQRNFHPQSYMSVDRSLKLRFRLVDRGDLEHSKCRNGGRLLLLGERP